MAVKNLARDIQGLDGVLKRMGAIGLAAEKSIASALYAEAQLVMTRSKAEFVPVDTGALRASGYVAKPAWSGSKVTVEMGFGGPSASYALKVHEDLETPHRTGSAKYLETPYVEAENGMLVRIAERVSKEVMKR